MGPRQSGFIRCFFLYTKYIYGFLSSFVYYRLPIDSNGAIFLSKGVVVTYYFQASYRLQSATESDAIRPYQVHLRRMVPYPAMPFFRD